MIVSAAIVPIQAKLSQKNFSRLVSGRALSFSLTLMGFSETLNPPQFGHCACVILRLL